MKKYYVFYNLVGLEEKGITLELNHGGEANRIYTLLKDQEDISYIELGKNEVENGLPVCKVFAQQSNRGEIKNHE